jgi:hypothetical protein
MELQKRQEIVEELQVKWDRGEPFSEEDEANIKRYYIKAFAERARKRTEHNGGETDCESEQITEDKLLQHLKAG